MYYRYRFTDCNCQLGTGVLREYINDNDVHIRLNA